MQEGGTVNAAMSAMSLNAPSPFGRGGTVNIPLQPTNTMNHYRASRKSLLDRPLGRGKTEVSESAFSFMFCEMVQYYQGRVQNISDLEKSLESAGYGVGVRVLELLSYRDVNGNLTR